MLVFLVLSLTFFRKEIHQNTFSVLITFVLQDLKLITQETTIVQEEGKKELVGNTDLTILANNLGFQKAYHLAQHADHSVQEAVQLAQEEADHTVVSNEQQEKPKDEEELAIAVKEEESIDANGSGKIKKTEAEAVVVKRGIFWMTLLVW